MGKIAKLCRLGLFQDSDFARNLEDSKSTSGETLSVFGSHTFVPISWMCRELNFSFTQFNRIRNHLFGSRIEVGWYSRTWFMGSDRCSSWEHESEPYRTGATRLWTNVKFVRHLTQFTNVRNLEEWSMIWIMLILFPQTSNFRIKKLCCMYLKTTKQWSRWS